MAGELQHELVQAPVVERLLDAEHQRHEQLPLLALGDPRVHAFAAGSHQRHRVRALWQRRLVRGVGLFVV